MPVAIFSLHLSIMHLQPPSHSPTWRSVPQGIAWAPPAPHVLIEAITSLQRLLFQVPSFSLWMSGNPIRHHLVPLPLFPHPISLQRWSFPSTKAFRGAPPCHPPSPTPPHASSFAALSTVIVPVVTTVGGLLQVIPPVPCSENADII